MHAFTGYDLVSAFTGKAKMIAYKLVKNSSLYEGAFGLLGSQIEISISIRYDLS